MAGGCAQGHDATQSVRTASASTHAVRTRAIAAASRGMGMSYKRAWSLVEGLNAMFRAPLVTSARGGAGGGILGLAVRNLDDE